MGCFALPLFSKTVNNCLAPPAEIQRSFSNLSSSVVVRRRPSSSVVVRRRPSSSVVVRRRRPSSSSVVVVHRHRSSPVVGRRRPSSSSVIVVRHRRPSSSSVIVIRHRRRPSSSVVVRRHPSSSVVVVNFSPKILISQKLAWSIIRKVPMHCKNVDIVESSYRSILKVGNVKFGTLSARR